MPFIRGPSQAIIQQQGHFGTAVDRIQEELAVAEEQRSHEDNEAVAAESSPPDNNNSNKEVNSTGGGEQEEILQSCIGKCRQAAPRTFYFLTQLVLPLLCLIGQCFFFGWLLARFEIQGEIESNDEVLKKVFRSYANHTTDRNQIWEAMAQVCVQCSNNPAQDEGLLQTSSSTTTADAAIENCSMQQGQERFPYEDYFAYVLQQEPELSFSWMKCYSPVDHETSVDLGFPYFGLNPADNHDEQYLRYILRFGDDMYNEFRKEYPDAISELDNLNVVYNEPLPHSEILTEYINNSTGSKGCQVHVAGGALFWFTIITTIGYGNTAPTTQGGRLLVFTCGFATIIGFLIVNNAAAKVWKYLFEDMFLRYNLNFLIKGPISFLFWLCMTILWMLVIALSMQAYRRTRSDVDIPLHDAYWFSYITTTTVGLGDIYIGHEEFKVKDMFIVPLVILIGFNFLGIFFEKGIDLHNSIFPEANGLRDILQERRMMQIDSGGGGKSPSLTH